MALEVGQETGNKIQKNETSTVVEKTGNSRIKRHHSITLSFIPNPVARKALTPGDKEG